MWYIWGLVLGAAGVGCNLDEARNRDSATEGTIRISVDESFRPVVEEQIRVYEASHPGTKILATYKPEAECWDDLLRDTIRLVIVTKKLTQEEASYYYDSLKLYPQSGQLAYDAVALVVNRKAPDSVFTTADVEGLLAGTSSLPYRPVFDGVKATSTVRYALDSILRGKPLDLARVTAARSSWQVVEYIARNPGYIGFTGISWIGNPEDSAQQEMLRRNVRIAWLACRGCGDTAFTKPVQEEILTNRYPYNRGIFYVLKEPYPGLGKAFVNFMKSDRGQLIFRRAYLVPAWRTFVVRDTQIKIVKPFEQ
ncbi:MAG TPA: substrate-binding domain-containing protein [Lacibacter sp.]|nr:substrate-binding domain-containing protein [Lacibacter sp.]HMO88887.1 substrate-binding domain-containing protein [Lacibacter sp.]